MRTMTSRFRITSCRACGGTHPKGTEIVKRRGAWVPVSCTSTSAPTTQRNATTRRVPCSECHDTRIGDDGYDCTRCEGLPKLAESVEPVEHTPPYADEFGPMPTDDDLARHEGGAS